MLLALTMHAAQTEFTLLQYADKYDIAWILKAGAPPEVIDYNSHFTKTFQQKQREFMDKTNIPIPISGEGRDFDTLCRDMAQNIHLLKESEASSQLPFSKETIEKYKDSKLVSISDDGMSFSFSFGIPMPE